MADGNITVEVSTQDAQKRLLHLHRENARLRRRIMADAATSDAAASSVANLAQSLAEARAEIDRLRAALAELLACHTESAGWSMSMLTDRAEFDAMLARSQERYEAAIGAAREALGPNDGGEPETTARTNL